MLLVYIIALTRVAGRLPHQSEVLEKEIEGVGRYTAGAICSMAYGVRTPVVGLGRERLPSLHAFRSTGTSIASSHEC
jgi:endonuclease III